MAESLSSSHNFFPSPSPRLSRTQSVHYSTKASPLLPCLSSFLPPPPAARMVFTEAPSPSLLSVTGLVDLCREKVGGGEPLFLSLLREREAHVRSIVLDGGGAKGPPPPPPPLFLLSLHSLRFHRV